MGEYMRSAANVGRQEVLTSDMARPFVRGIDQCVACIGKHRAFIYAHVKWEGGHIFMNQLSHEDREAKNSSLKLKRDAQARVASHCHVIATLLRGCRRLTVQRENNSE